MRLQPTFSFQKYESENMTRDEQFQHQLQQQHILVANAINTTIGDLSYYSTERRTDFLWVFKNKPIWTITAATVAWTSVGTVNTIPLNISGGFTVVDMVCCISSGTSTLLMPNLDVSTAANSISIVRNGANVILTSGGTDYSAYSGYVTVYYTKP